MPNTRRNVIITDLDDPDNQETPTVEENHRKVHKKRTKEKHLQTLKGNFSRRSHSAECKPEDRGLREGDGDRTNKNIKIGYFNELVSC